MIPTTLIQLENYPGFIGTFDQIDWWRSEPIPNAVDILSVCWIYGEYHVCATKNVNGSYSIWQTYDHGYRWREALNTNERIFCIIRPNYGQALISTSGGWWRSTNSGTSWTKISTQAPNCHTVKELTNDILIALDGTYIWRSANGGAAWTKAVINGTETPVIAVTQYPTVAGIYNDCFVGCVSTNVPKQWMWSGFHANEIIWQEPEGYNQYSAETKATIAAYTMKDNLLLSEDGGVSFVFFPLNLAWCTRESKVPMIMRDWGYGLGGYATNVDINTISNLFPRQTYNDIITDIEMVGTQGSGRPYLVIQVRMPSGYLRHYYIKRTEYFWIKARFDAFETPGQSLDSYFSVQPGTSNVISTVVFSGMTSSGTPLIKVSNDHGYTWTDVNLLNVTVYDNQDMLHSTSNPIVDDYYVKYSWVHGPCHNGWTVLEGYRQVFQSYDLDYILEKEYIVPSYLDALIAKKFEVPQDFDALVEDTFTKTYDSDLIIERTHIYNYKNRAYFEGTYTHGQDFNTIIALPTYLDYDFDARFEKITMFEYPMHVHIEKNLTKGYSMGVQLVSANTAWMWDFFSPQIFNLIFPDNQSPPFDSRA